MGLLAGVGDFGLTGILQNANAANTAANAANTAAVAAMAGLQEGKDLGPWNAATNSPPLTANASAAPDGGYYNVTVAGAMPFAGANFASAYQVEVGARLAKIGSQWYLRPNTANRRLDWVGASPIVFDFASRTITIAGGFFVDGKQYYNQLANVVVPMNSAPTDGVHGFFVDIANPNSLQYYVKRFSDFASVPVTAIRFASWMDVDGRELTYTGAKFNQLKQYTFISQSAAEITFDFTARTLTVPVGFWVYKKEYYFQQAQAVVTLPNTSGINALFVRFVAPYAATYYAVNYTQFNTVPDDAIPLCHWLNAGGFGLTFPGNKVDKVAGKGLSTNDYTTAEKNKLAGLPSSVPAPFSETVHRLILPPKMFLVNDVDLPVYKASIIASSSVDVFKTALVEMNLNSGQLAQPKYNYFADKVPLRGADLLPTTSIQITRTGNKNYIGTSAFQVVTRASLNGKSATVLHIGDSLTNRGIGALTKAVLASWNATITYIGAMSNASALGYPGQPGEGREGWKYSTFVGKCNADQGGTAITPGYVQNNLYKNPFLKMATASDKANNPTWCFRNTGASSELSYADDPNKTGDFYIFDFANYLSTTGAATPKVVTICLSTNDLLQMVVTQAVAEIPTYLEIMIRQIKAAAPTCRIAIVPLAPWGYSASAWTDACQLAETIMTKVKALQTAGITGLDVLGIAAHVNREFNFSYAAGSPLSTTNDTQVVTLSDAIHWADQGRVEYSYAMASYLANML